MSEDKGPARPRQVTMAVVVAVIGSLVLVIGLFDTLGRLRTPATRTAVDEFLAEAPGSSLDIDTAQVVDLMRALAFVSGALAAMGLVFAIFVMQRHRGARIGFTVVAALLLLTVPVAGAMPFFLAAAAFLLWTQPARDWYAGRAPVAAGEAAARPFLSQADPSRDRPAQQPTPDPTPPPYEQPYGQAPPPYGQPYGQAPRPPQTPQPPQAPQTPPQQPQEQPYGQAPPSYGQPAFPTGAEGYAYPAQPGAAPGKRPVTVTIAAALTWLGAGSTALLMVLFMAVLAAGSDAFIEEFERAAQDSQVEFTSDQVLAVGWVVGVTMLVWALIAVVLAVFVVRRSNAARIMLVISAVMSALFSLVAITSVVSVVTLLLSVATVILLFTGGANEWFSGRSGGPGSAAYPPGYPSYYLPPTDPGRQELPGQQPGPPPAQPQPPKRNQPW